MKVLRIKQFINGVWVDLIDMEIEGNPPASAIKESVEGLSKLSMDSDFFWISNDKYESVVISKSQGPIKIVLQQQSDTFNSR